MNTFTEEYQRIVEPLDFCRWRVVPVRRNCAGMGSGFVFYYRTVGSDMLVWTELLNMNREVYAEMW